MEKKIKIGIIAPSSKVPKVELKLGLQSLKKRGFEIDVHEQCRKSYLFFSGTDEQRADAFYEFAKNPDLSVLWCARGGYGAMRILPLIEKWVKKEGIPQKKLLIGYSDATSLMEYVRSQWGWSILHAPMPSMRTFSFFPESIFETLERWLGGQRTLEPWREKKLKFLAHSPQVKKTYPLVGGNLTVWGSMIGSAFQGNARGCFLFFEDINESLYRIDRVLQQILLSGGFEGVQGIVLGSFLNCRDEPVSVLRKVPHEKERKKVLRDPKKSHLTFLRKPFPDQTGLKVVFLELAIALKIPVAYGLPVGHGSAIIPLPLGARYCLTPDGDFKLVQWDWLR